MTAWMFVTRWGNAMLLFPAASWIGLSLWAGGERAIARRWILAFGAAVLLVFATKVAFLGWGIGSRALDYTGISGHSMLAAAVLPMFAWWLVQDRDDATRRRTIVGSALFAIVVGLSRVLLSTHSASEVVAGLALGLAVAGVSIPHRRVPADHVRLRWLVLFLLIGAGSLSSIGDTDDAHGLVVRIALAWSGRDAPFTRAML